MCIGVWKSIKSEGMQNCKIVNVVRGDKEFMQTCHKQTLGNTKSCS